MAWAASGSKVSSVRAMMVSSLGEDHLKEQVWLGRPEATAGRAHGLVAAHGSVARRMKAGQWPSGLEGRSGFDWPAPGLRLISSWVFNTSPGFDFDTACICRPIKDLLPAQNWLNLCKGSKLQEISAEGCGGRRIPWRKGPARARVQAACT